MGFRSGDWTLSRDEGLLPLTDNLLIALLIIVKYQKNTGIVLQKEPPTTR